MKHEDDLARRDAEAYHKLLHGDRSGVAQQGDADEMGDNIYLGDYSVTQSMPQSYESAKPQGSGVLGKALLGAGLLATGAGMGVGIPLLLDAAKDVPAAVKPEIQPETKTIKEVYDFEVLPPVFGKPE